MARQRHGADENVSSTCNKSHKAFMARSCLLCHVYLLQLNSMKTITGKLLVTSSCIVFQHDVSVCIKQHKFTILM